MPNLAFTVFRGSLTVVVCLNGRQLPTDDEWDRYLECIRGLIAETGGDLGNVRGMAISDGGAPSARQRKLLDEVTGARSMRWTLLSISRFARGVGAALAWLQPDFNAYAPSGFARAARFLGVPDGEQPALLATIRDLDRAIGLQAVAELEEGGFELEKFA